MTETVLINKSIGAPAEKVWAAIEGIGGLDRWFPIIEACRVEGAGVGAVRVLTLAGGAGEMRDRIVEIAPQQMRLRYHRTHLPFPVSDYFGEVQVLAEAPGRARLVWTVRFEAVPEERDPIRALLQGAISEGVDGLARELGASAPS